MNNLHKDPLGNKTFDDGTPALSHVWIVETIKRLALADASIEVPMPDNTLKSIELLWSHIDQTSPATFDQLVLNLTKDTYTDPTKGKGRLMNCIRVSPDMVTLLISGKSVNLRMGMLNELALLRQLINRNQSVNLRPFDSVSGLDGTRIQQIVDAANGRWPGYYPVSYVDRLAEGQGVKRIKLSTREDRIATARVLRDESDALGHIVRTSLSKNGVQWCNSYHVDVYKVVYPQITIQER